MNETIEFEIEWIQYRVSGKYIPRNHIVGYLKAGKYVFDRATY